MSWPPSIELATTGRPEAVSMETSVRRALDQARGLIGESESYAPGDASAWASPAPTTQDQAIDRLAAAVKGLLGSPIP